MLTTNFKLLKDALSCEDGYKKLAKALGGIRRYGKETPINLLQILEINGLDDTLWCFGATIQNSDHIAIKFAVMCAQRVLPLFERIYPNDTRPRKCVETVWLFLEGKATIDDINAAGEAVWDAFSEVVSTADSAIASSAIWVAASVASINTIIRAAKARAVAAHARNAVRDVVTTARASAAANAVDVEIIEQEKILRELLS